MRTALAFLTVALLGPGCMSGTNLEPGAGSLVGAAADTDHPGVGILRVGPGACTATLVAPQVVVTVKHCFPTGEIPPMRFLLGPNGDQEVARGGPIFYRTPPEGYRRQSHDIVAVLLDQPVSAPIIPVRRAPLTDDREGAIVSLVGYGLTAQNADDWGLRRSGPATLDSIDRDEFETVRRDGQTTSCDGDSGGAVVLDGELAGVIIGSVWGNCRKTSIHTRVDRHLDVVDQALAAAAEAAVPQAPGAEEQPPADEAPAADDVQPNAMLCQPGYCVGGDGLCDEELTCCDSDPDCAHVDPEPPVCECDVTWGCDDCWCEPADECP